LGLQRRKLVCVHFVIKKWILPDMRLEEGQAKTSSGYES
jgi:hypothetical protein